MADNPTFTTTVATLPSGTVAGLMQEATTGALVPRGVSVFQTGGSTGAWTFTLAASGAGAVTGGTQRITLASDDPAVTSLAILDDWDESDRCKVNLVAGQAGITAGAGAVGASTPRVTLASDDPAVVALQILDNIVSGSEAQVDIVGALPTGSNVIGAVTQSGTWTVQPGNTANTTAWLVTGAGGVFPVTDNGGSLTVDNGGAFVVQENGAALAALQSLASAVLTEDAAHSSGDKGIMPLAVRKDSGGALAGADGDYIPLQTDANGYLRVNVSAGGASGGTSSTDDAAFTAASGSGTPMMGFVTSDNVDAGDVGVVGMLANRQLKVTLYDSAGAELAVGGGTQYDEDAAHSTGSKVTGCGIVRKDTAASLAGTDGDYTLPIADANGKLWVNSEVTVALPAGTNAIGKLAANSGVDIGDVDVTSVVPGTGATNLGKAEDAAHSSGDTGVFVLTVRSDTAASTAGTNGDYAALITDSSGRLHTVSAASPPSASATVTGCTPYFDSDGDNTAQTIKGSAGNLYFLEVSNPNSTDAYLQLYDESGAITVGTTTPKLSFLVPAGDGTNDGAFDRVFVVPISFANSIKYACTTTATGSGDPTTGLIVNAGYL